VTAFNGMVECDARVQQDVVSKCYRDCFSDVLAPAASPAAQPAPSPVLATGEAAGAGTSLAAAAVASAGAGAPLAAAPAAAAAESGDADPVRQLAVQVQLLKQEVAARQTTVAAKRGPQNEVHALRIEIKSLMKMLSE
jgi:hypothetical protein